MQHTAQQDALASIGRWTAISLVVASLAACGGGGGSPGTNGSGTGTTPPTTPTTPTTPVVSDPKISIALTSATGSTVTSLSGGQGATVKATVLTAAGAPAVGAIVQFTSSASTLATFTPETGSALTDANGVATVTVKPASVTSAGAVAITATSVVETKTVTASSNITIGAAPLTVGTLSFTTTQTGPLPAFSTVSLNIPVTTGGQPATGVSGLSLNSLCVGQGTATLVPGAFANGVQSATYTNNGCTLVRDTISVSVGNSTQTIGLDVASANIGAIQFTGSSVTGTSIVLKGSGGLGRSEAAQLSFKVVDQQGNGLSGVNVDFAATTNTGGLTVSPMRATSDSAGQVSTTVSSGTIPTPVRVSAEATRNGVKITGLSDALTVSTGLPMQKFMSMSAEVFNIEGADRDGITTDITVMMADQYGNPVSDNTAVNFVTEGGSIGTAAQGACLTKDGACTVVLRSQEFKPADGRVTVLAYAQGIENFVDLNGDGQYTCTGWTGAAAYRPLVDTCPVGGEPFVDGDMGDPFLDTDRNGVYEPAKGDLPFPYNSASYKQDGDGKWGLNYIRRSLEIVFAGSYPRIVRQFMGSAGWRDWNEATDGDPFVVKGITNATTCAEVELRFRVTDRVNNPLPLGTTVATSSPSNVSLTQPSPATVAVTTSVGGTTHSLTVKPNASCAAGSFNVDVKTPRGSLQPYTFKYN